MPAERFLVARAGARSCAFPLHQVIEIMRPPTVTSLGGPPAPCLGYARIRGEAVPVLDLARLLGESATPSRAITVRSGGRTVAVLATSVEGVTSLAATAIRALPPSTEESAVRGVALHRGELMAVLDAAESPYGAAASAVEAPPRAPDAARSPTETDG